MEKHTHTNGKRAGTSTLRTIRQNRLEDIKSVTRDSEFYNKRVNSLEICNNYKHICIQY